MLTLTYIGSHALYFSPSGSATLFVASVFSTHMKMTMKYTRERFVAADLNKFKSSLNTHTHTHIYRHTHTQVKSVTMLESEYIIIHVVYVADFQFR